MHVIKAIFTEYPALIGLLTIILYATCQKLPHPDKFATKWYYPVYFGVFQVLARASLTDFDKGLRSLFSHPSLPGIITPSLDEARESGRGFK